MAAVLSAADGRPWSGLNQRLVHRGRDAQLGDPPAPSAVVLVLGIAKGRGCVPVLPVPCPPGDRPGPSGPDHRGRHRSPRQAAAAPPPGRPAAREGPWRWVAVLLGDL